MKKIIFLSLVSLFLLASYPLQEAHGAICKVGDKAQVLWGGKWWSAKVIGVNKAGNRCKIHYKGYGSNWDEWVGPNRIRITSSGTPPPPSSGGYYVGQRIRVLWGGKWWKAKILKKSGSRYYIKYDGYGSKWNEWVTTARMKPR